MIKPKLSQTTKPKLNSIILNEEALEITPFLLHPMLSAKTGISIQKTRAIQTMITFERALREDYTELSEIIKDAFEEDKKLHGEGPELYENPEKLLEYIDSRRVWKLLYDARPVGCLVVFAGKGRDGVLGCIALLPSLQNQGLGTEALQWLELQYCAVRCWKLDTPAINARTRHFYEKNGYVKSGEIHDGIDLIIYKKDLDAPINDPDGGCLYKDLPKLGFDAEYFEDLIKVDNVRTERIISRGQSSPEMGFYDQDWTEIVLVIAGHAKLEIEGKVIELRSGDWRCIHPHQKHRVLSTSHEPACVWYAIHIEKS